MREVAAVVLHGGWLALLGLSCWLSLWGFVWLALLSLSSARSPLIAPLIKDRKNGSRKKSSHQYQTKSHLRERRGPATRSAPPGSTEREPYPSAIASHSKRCIYEQPRTAETTRRKRAAAQQGSARRAAAHHAYNRPVSRQRSPRSPRPRPASTSACS